MPPEIVIEMDPCTGCCAEALTCTGMEGRTKGGTATLCGFSEYASPSTPPKKYRKQTLSGYHDACQYGTVPCTGTLDPRTHDAYTGTYTYNATTCAETNAQLRTRTSDSPGSTCGSAAAGATAGGTDVPARDFAPVATGSTNTRTATTDTFDYDVCEGGSNVKKLGQVVATLSEEDTEADAVTRGAFSWSSWASVGGGSCSGTPPPCTLAKWESRGAGDFSLDYQEAEYRIAYTGKTAGKLYSTQVDYYRRTYGSGSYTLYQTVTLTETADGSGNLTFSGTVPNERGYETYAVCH